MCVKLIPICMLSHRTITLLASELVHAVLSACIVLQRLGLRLPYHSSAFMQAVELLAKLECDAMQRITLFMDQYLDLSGPGPTDWECFDKLLQWPEYSESAITIALARQPRMIDGTVPAWGEHYAFVPIDGGSWRDDLQTFLPETLKRQRPSVEYSTGRSVDTNAIMWRRL